MEACPDISELEHFLIGDPDADHAASIRNHASSCTACQASLDDIRANLQIVGPIQQAMNRSDPNSAHAADPTPETIGSYRVFRELGRGGMGIVYEAQQLNPQRSVAIKVLNASWNTDGRVALMFRREAHALGRLRHPAIAAIHEAGQTAETVIFAWSR